MKNVNVPDVKFTTLKESATLPEAYAVAVAADAVEQKVKGAQGNVYDVIRYHVVNLFREHLKKSDDDPQKIVVGHMVGDYLLMMEQAEKSVDGDVPQTWTSVRSRFKFALENGYNFQDNPTVAQNKLSKWQSDLNKKRKEDKERQEMEAARKRAGDKVEDLDKGKPGAGAGGSSSSNADGGGQSSSAGNGNTGDVPVVDTVLSGLSDHTQSQILELISMAKEVEAADEGLLRKKLDNVFIQAKNQLSGSHAKALVALKKAS